MHTRGMLRNEAVDEGCRIKVNSMYRHERLRFGVLDAASQKKAFSPAMG